MQHGHYSEPKKPRIGGSVIPLRGDVCRRSAGCALQVCGCERDSLKPSTAELGLGTRPIVRASPQRLGKSLKSYRAERWGCDSASSWQPDQPDECRTRLSRTHVSDLPRRTNRRASMWCSAITAV